VHLCICHILTFPVHANRWSSPLSVNVPVGELSDTKLPITRNPRKSASTLVPDNTTVETIRIQC